MDDDWLSCALGEIISLEYGSALGAEERTGDGYPVFGSNGVVGHHATALVLGPGIVVGRKGSAGALAWSNSDFWPIDTTYWVKPKAALDLRWVYDALRRCGLERLHSSTGVPGLNRDDAYERRVPVPPLEEQRRIAEILDAIDETVQATERVIAKLELVRLGLREEFCTPDRSSTDPVPLAAMVKSVVDCPHSTPEFLDSGVLVARTMHIKNGRFLAESASRVSEASYQDRIARMTPAPGDVVLTREAPVGEAFAIPEGLRICLGQRVVLVRTGAGLLGQYLVELIYSSQGQRQIRRLSAGTTNPHLNVDDIRDLAFNVPSPEVQREALRTLAAATSEIDVERAKLLKLKQTRAGLAADLLSGRVRAVAA